MENIKSLSHLKELVKPFAFTRGLTNNYKFPEHFETQIKEIKLYYKHQDGNLLLLSEKNDFFLLYFYIQSKDGNFNIDCKKPLVLEFPYNEKTYPSCAYVKNYFLSKNFRESGIRKRMVRSKSPISVTENEDNDIYFPQECDSSEILNLYNSCFSVYTGCIPSKSELTPKISDKNIIAVKNNNNIAAVLEYRNKYKTSTLEHLACKESERGKGYAKKLLSFWINNTAESCDSYNLWTMQDNTAAIQLYEKFSFASDNYFSLVMIKSNV